MIALCTEKKIDACLTYQIFFDWLELSALLFLYLLIRVFFLQTTKNILKIGLMRWPLFFIFRFESTDQA